VNLECLPRKFPRCEWILDTRKEYPEKHQVLMLLDMFFEAREFTEIAMILNGCVAVAYIISPFIEGRNLLIYTQTSSY
jgi:hypothetical protein